MASVTARCDAEIHIPRPGSLRFRSAITSPEGATTKRISSSIGRTCRVTAHIRIVADLSVRGPLSRSGSTKASMDVTSLLSSAHYGCAKPVSSLGSSPRANSCGTRPSNRLVFGGRGLLGLFGEIGLGDPARDDARLHDHVLSIIARGFIGI